MSNDIPSILVAGASGRLGQLVFDQLAGAPSFRLIAASRTPEKLTQLANKQIEVRAADFSDPSTLSAAFAGVDRLLLISTSDLFSGKRVEQHRNAIDAAVQAGVNHIVYTSMPDPEGSAAIPFAQDHVATEAALKQSGLGYTILRVAWYAENPFDLGLVAAALKSGKWFTAAGSGRIAYVPRLDVARVAAACLTAKALQSGVYDVTGVSADSPETLAAALSAASGKAIQVVPVSDEQLKSELAGYGVPSQHIPMLVATDANTRAGRFDIQTDIVEQRTGTPPLSFEQFIRANQQLLPADLRAS